MKKEFTETKKEFREMKKEFREMKKEKAMHYYSIIYL